MENIPSLPNNENQYLSAIYNCGDLDHLESKVIEDLIPRLKDLVKIRIAKQENSHIVDLFGLDVSELIQ